jgi:pimeloyl-ACP methyl ester carboxylesterase
MNVYFISGVGADRRIFRNIKLPDFCHVAHLDWIKPLKNESLANYAQRLAEGIDKSQPFVLVGLSFGGMLANEIDKLYRAEKVILISSIPSAAHLPSYYKLAGRLHLQKLVPVSLLKSASLMKRLFTAETKEEKSFLRQAIREADPDFIKWSLDAIVHWQTDTPPHNYIHIHGTGDLILPLRYAGCTHGIRKAGHLMVITCGKQISEIITRELEGMQQEVGKA